MSEILINILHIEYSNSESVNTKVYLQWHYYQFRKLQMFTTLVQPECWSAFPSQKIGATIVFNTCCEPLPNLTLMRFYLKTQKGVVLNQGAPIEASSKRQESSHMISSHCTVTALECFSLLKKSIFCCLALVRSTVSSRQPTCIHFSCRHTIA